MLSSKKKTKQFLFEKKNDMPVLGLFNYRKFLFQRLKVLMAGIFQVVKPFCFTNGGSVRNFARVISQNEMFYSRFCKNAKLFKLCQSWEKKSQVLSEFKIVNLVVLLSAWQNWLIEEKSVERLLAIF
jgi:hypothetical protein